MPRYKILNLHTGAHFGAYEAATPEGAVAAMCREAGYPSVTAGDGRLVFPDEETARLCGDLGEAWEATEIDAGTGATALEWWDWFSRKGSGLTEMQVEDWWYRFSYQYTLRDGEVGLDERQARILGDDVDVEGEIRDEIGYLRREVWRESA